MLINLRNALMTGKRLPYDAEVEYLLFDGTTSRRQYIETGIKVADPASVKIEVNSDAILSLGFTHNNSTTGTWVGVYNSTAVRVYYKDYSTGQSITPPSNIDAYIYDGGSGFYINGSQYASFVASVGTDSITDKSWRFGEVYDFKNEGGRTDSAFNRSGKLYCLKIYVNGVLVRDFIPVRRGTVGYLYDRVSGKLFGNAGTGDFVLGPDVVPVEYIESHGTEYIDTGFKASNSTRVAVDFERKGGTTNCWILGARNGSSSATDKFALFCGINNTAYAMIGSAVNEFSSATIKTGRHLLEMSLAGGVVVDSQIVATYSASEQAEVFSAAYTMALFNLWSGSLNNPFIGKYYACDFWDNGAPVRKYYPVRVGTDATSWEGAVMDVLTRRIYRNAGTGAFTYGNDLKYPIPAA